MQDFINLLYHADDLPLTCAAIVAVLLCVEFVSAVFSLISDMSR